jgi:hypothetical protein
LRDTLRKAPLYSLAAVKQARRQRLLLGLD